MNVKLLAIKGTWREVANAANTTINKEIGEKEPSSQWKRRLLLCEHSPIRKIHINWKWYDLKRWISDHFVRHKFGIEHWVKTDRSDRTGINRDELSQSSLTNHECEANPQAIINISRKRLCNQASKETREAWQELLESFKDKQPELYSVCVPDCIYRAWCYEYKSCGFHKTQEFQEKLTQYRKDINE
jgi:hypothetical protein